MNKKLVILICVLLLMASSLSLCIDSNDDTKKPKTLLELTIEDMEYSYKVLKKDDGYLSSADGNKFFLITLTIKNLDNSRHKISPIDLSLNDLEDNDYAPLTDELDLEIEQLAEVMVVDGKSVQGTIVFDIPEDATPYNLYCSPDWSKEVVVTINASKIKQPPVEPNIVYKYSEKIYGIQIEITSVSVSVKLEDIKFIMIDSDGVLLYSVTIDDTNPAKFNKGESTIYAMTLGSEPVKDSSNNTIDGYDALSDYSGCYIAYIDQSANGKLNEGDTFYIYSDYDADDVNEIEIDYEARIIYSDTIICKIELESVPDNGIIVTAKNPTEKTYGYQIELTKITGGTLKLEDAKFQVIDSKGALLYSVNIDDANPAPFNKGDTTVYAMTHGSSPVKDANNNTIDGGDALSEYRGCYIAYLDQNSDGGVNGGDSIYIYKDFDDDNTDEILSGYNTFKLMAGDTTTCSKIL